MLSLKLEPVTFHYKKDLDPDRIIQFGLIAEQVGKIDPELVVRDDDDKVTTVRYEAVNVILLNEFLKEHRKVEELEATVARHEKDSHTSATKQEREIETLTAALKAEAAQIQKVNAQLKVNRSAPRLVSNKE